MDISQVMVTLEAVTINWNMSFFVTIRSQVEHLGAGGKGLEGQKEYGTFQVLRYVHIWQWHNSQ